MSEETTQDLPGRQPTLADIKEAINSVSVELHSFRASVEKRLDALEATMNERFEGVESSINVLSGDVTRLRGGTLSIAAKRLAGSRVTFTNERTDESESKDKQP